MLQDMNRLNLDIARASSNDGRRDAQNLTTDARTATEIRANAAKPASRARRVLSAWNNGNSIRVTGSTIHGCRNAFDQRTRQYETKRKENRKRKRKEEKRRGEKRREEKRRTEKRKEVTRSVSRSVILWCIVKLFRVDRSLSLIIKEKFLQYCYR